MMKRVGFQFRPLEVGKKSGVSTRPAYIVSFLAAANQKIVESAFYSRHLNRGVISTDQGDREMIGLELKYLRMWLSSINPARVKPEVREHEGFLRQSPLLCLKYSAAKFKLRHYHLLTFCAIRGFFVQPGLLVQSR